MQVSGQHHVLATLLLGKEPLGTQCLGGWTGTRAGLKTSEKRKISCPLLATEPKFLVCPVYNLLTLSAILSQLLLKEHLKHNSGIMSWVHCV